MKCISHFNLFRGLGKSTCSISIQLEQVKIVKVFSFFPLPLNMVCPKLEMEWMDLLFVPIALGTANQDGAVENLFSRWDVLFLP